jgi:O-acetyl-ADP-ribose deacetylase (regulator of RNase III)
VKEAEGSLLDADVEALVNPVNTAGVMGKGLALQFKQAYPDNFRVYRNACDLGFVRLGRIFMYATNLPGNPRFILNFPTKGHWRDASRLGDIKAGLDDLRQFIADFKVRSIAIPALGCGLGGLDWDDVRPLIAEALGDLSGVQVVVYPPRGVTSLVVHCKKSRYDVYIGRPGLWGNPYAIGKDGTRAEVITKYRRYLEDSPELMARLPELRGKILGCWCAPQPCHGDILAELAMK